MSLGAWFIRFHMQKNNLSQIVTYEDDFMKVKIYIVINSEKRINT